MRIAPISIAVAALAFAVWIAHAGRPSGNIYIDNNLAQAGRTGVVAAGHLPTHKWQLHAETSPTKVIRLSLEQVT
jgi:hypothetical protein